jgi:hypothetical protein
MWNDRFARFCSHYRKGNDCLSNNVSYRRPILGIRKNFSLGVIWQVELTVYNTWKRIARYNNVSKTDCSAQQGRRVEPFSLIWALDLLWFRHLYLHWLHIYSVLLQNICVKHFTSCLMKQRAFVFWRQDNL